MKTTIILFFAALLINTTHAQTIENDTIKKSGEILTGKTINGKKNGYWKRYLKNYSKELILFQEGAYTNDQKQGKWITYYNGKIKKIENYKNDNLNGEEIFYYENGQISSKGNYIDDEPDGEHISYYDNGQVKSIENYSKGKENGKAISYFKNGKTEIYGYFKNGLEDGEFAQFDKNGKVLNKGNFKNGEKTGLWTETEIDEGKYLGGVYTVTVSQNNYTTKEISKKVYGRNGELLRTETWKNDKLVTQVNESNKVLTDEIMESGFTLAAFLNDNLKKIFLKISDQNAFFKTIYTNTDKYPPFKFVCEDGKKIYIRNESATCSTSKNLITPTLGGRTEHYKQEHFSIYFSEKIKFQGISFDTIDFCFNFLPEKDQLRIFNYFRFKNNN